MRRFLSLVLATSLTLGTLPALGGQEERPPGGSPGNVQPPAPPPPPPPPAPPPPPPPPAPAPTYLPAPTPAPYPPAPPSVSASGTITVVPPNGQQPVYAVPPDTGLGNLYEVYVRDDAPGMVHRLSFTDGRPIAACTGNCTFRVPPGQYVLEVEGTAELRAGKKTINVAGPTVVDVSPGSKSTRTTGLVLGVVGPVAVFVGMIGALVVAADNAVRADCRGTSCNRESHDATGWVVLLLAGVGATTAGWIMFGTASTKIKPSLGLPPMQPASPPAVALGVLPTRGGASFGLSVTF